MKKNGGRKSHATVPLIKCPKILHPSSPERGWLNCHFSLVMLGHTLLQYMEREILSQCFALSRLRPCTGVHNDINSPGFTRWQKTGFWQSLVSAGRGSPWLVVDFSLCTVQYRLITYLLQEKDTNIGAALSRAYTSPKNQFVAVWGGLNRWNRHALH